MLEVQFIGTRSYALPVGVYLLKLMRNFVKDLNVETPFIALTLFFIYIYIAQLAIIADDNSLFMEHSAHI